MIRAWLATIVGPESIYGALALASILKVIADLEAEDKDGCPSG